MKYNLTLMLGGLILLLGTAPVYAGGDCSLCKSDKDFEACSKSQRECIRTATMCLNSAGTLPTEKAKVQAEKKCWKAAYSCMDKVDCK